MHRPDDEEQELRSVALQNAQSILVARRRAEAELLEAKEALERKTSELAHSLAMLRATLESTTDAILVTDRSGRVTDFNEQFQVLWRVPPELVTTRDRGRLLAALAGWFPDPQVFRDRVDAIDATSPRETYDLLELGDGRTIERFSRIQSVAGENVGRVWSFRDITRGRRSEATSRFLAEASAALTELASHETIFRRVADLAVPAFADWCAVDMQEADGSIHRLAVTHADPARAELARELFRRYPPRPDDGFGVTAVLSTGKAEWRPAIPDALLELAARDPEHLRLVRELGLKSYICVPLRARNRTIGVLSFVTAESGRSYEEEDLAAAEDLAHRAGIALENATLVGVLKDADRRKDEFLAMLAHELRNPLAPIRNAMHILRTLGPPSPELQWAREVIDRQVHQMTRLVDDLLDVSRITRGKIELRREQVDLATVIQAAIEASRPLLEKWGHELRIEIPEEPVWLDADATRLAQVFLNLLNNAAKYTDHGGRIVLSAERAGRDVLVRVRDNGIGITPEMLPRIFEVFAQADRSLDRAEGGLGIGLTLVRLLVELHGGSVAARSEGPGRGSEFRVCLPTVAEPGPAAAPPRSVGNLAAPAARRILVVDDSRDAADSLSMLLRLAGNEVQTAYDGLEAVGAAAVFHPDVVLLDIGLPKLNGFDAARSIRSGRGDGVLLIALTGWGQEDDRRRSREAGFDFHLTKPVELEEINRLLRQRGTPHPAPPT